MIFKCKMSMRQSERTPGPLKAADDYNDAGGDDDEE